MKKKKKKREKMKEKKEGNLSPWQDAGDPKRRTTRRRATSRV